MKSDRHTVLVVEDEALLRFILSDALQEAGYDVLEASNVLEAVGMLGKHDDIDAIVTDIDMPGGLNGLDLVGLVHSCGKNIATIVTSGGRSMRDDELPGAGRFLAKPYRLDDVLGILKASIRRDMRPASRCA